MLPLASRALAARTLLTVKTSLTVRTSRRATARTAARGKRPILCESQRSERKGEGAGERHGAELHR